MLYGICCVCVYGLLFHPLETSQAPHRIEPRSLRKEWLMIIGFSHLVKTKCGQLIIQHMQYRSIILSGTEENSQEYELLTYIQIQQKDLWFLEVLQGGNSMMLSFFIFGCLNYVYTRIIPITVGITGFYNKFCIIFLNFNPISCQISQIYAIIHYNKLKTFRSLDTSVAKGRMGSYSEEFHLPKIYPK